MHRLLLVFFIVLISKFQMDAQSNSLVGEYSLVGVMETASGFRLNPDSTFDFYFSYGALDRGGSGVWHVKDSNVVLNSKKDAGDPFILKSSTQTKENTFTVIIDDPNPFFKKYVHGFISGKTHEEEQQANKDGILRFPAAAYDTLMMMMEFSQEKVFRFNLKGSTDNQFTFTFNPTLLEVFFHDFVLKADPNGLRGSHPLLDPKKEYLFEKVQ
ncbi:MAG: hypothetical protein IPQ03_02170 [Bacteroidetes bacterium]|nr:hypothetical protein [Bacteroidota bacterium]